MKELKYKKYLLVITLVILDQLIKLIVLENLSYVKNTGMAFGFYSNGSVVLIIVNTIIISVLVWIMFFKKINKNVFLSLSLIIAGGIGNLIDRVFRGYVIDYIDINKLIKYPVFNFADICVFIGVILLGIAIYFGERKAK